MHKQISNRIVTQLSPQKKPYKGIRFFRGKEPVLGKKGNLKNGIREFIWE